MHIQTGASLKYLPADFIRDANAKNIGTGIVSGIFGISVCIVFIGAGKAAGLSTVFIMMWLTGMYLINGIFGILVPGYYRLPIPMANSIPGSLLFAASIPTFGLAPVLGATFIAGLLSLLIGVSGAMERIMRFAPMPIVMGMVAGILLKFGLGMIKPLESTFVPAVIMLAAFLIGSQFLKQIPPVLTSLIAGFIYLLITGFDLSSVPLSINYPHFVLPSFSLDAFLAYGLPLTIILVGMETPAGIGIIKGMGYNKTPINGITVINGFGTMLASFFHLHSTCIAAPMTAICSSPDAGEKDKRWVAAVVTGILWVCAAPFMGTIVAFISATPKYFISIIAGLALIRVLISAMGTAFHGKSHSVGALFAFLVAASGIKLLGVGAPFWALIIGILISLIIETNDFK